MYVACSGVHVVSQSSCLSTWITSESSSCDRRSACGWKRHCLQSDTYLALKITRAGAAFSCTYACKPAWERKQRPLIKISPPGWPFAPVSKSSSQLFTPSVVPSFCCYQCDGRSVQWSYQSFPADVNPLPFAPSLSLLFPNGAHSSLCLLHTTTSTSVSTFSMHRKQLHSPDRKNVCVCVCWMQSRNKQQNMCVYLSGIAGVCLWIKQGGSVYCTSCRRWTIWIERGNLEKKGAIFFWFFFFFFSWAMQGRRVSSNAISFWCSSSSKQTLWAMPPG